MLLKISWRKVHVGRDVTGLKNVQKVNLVDEFYRKNGVKEEEYTSTGKLNPSQYFTRGGGGADSHLNGTGITMGKLELNLLRRPIWVLYSLFVPPCKSFSGKISELERVYNPACCILSFFEWTRCERLSIIFKLKTSTSEAARTVILETFASSFKRIRCFDDL